MKNKPKPAKIAKKLEQLNEKIESDADNIREKYPEIAKMTVAEVVATNLFVIGLRKAIANYNRFIIKVAGTYYAFQSLKRNNTLEPENFRREYIACIDKESKMPAVKRNIVLAIGNDAYRRTVKQMMDNYDAIQNGEVTDNPQITIGTKIRLKTNPNVILNIISNDCHGDEFECSNGSVLSLKQIEKYYDIIK